MHFERVEFILNLPIALLLNGNLRACFNGLASKRIWPLGLSAPFLLFLEELAAIQMLVHFAFVQLHTKQSDGFLELVKLQWLMIQ